MRDVRTKDMMETGQKSVKLQRLRAKIALAAARELAGMTPKPPRKPQNRNGFGQFMRAPEHKMIEYGSKRGRALPKTAPGQGATKEKAGGNLPLNKGDTPPRGGRKDIAADVAGSLSMMRDFMIAATLLVVIVNDTSPRPPDE